MGDRIVPAVVATAMLSLAEVAMAVEISEIQGSWRLAEAGGAAVEQSDNAPRFTLENGLIHGYDGCNQFSGQLDAPQMMVMGQRACASDQVRLPLDLSDPKKHLEAGTLEGGRLALPPRGDLPAAIFERAAE